jgi:hypothetical protein
MRLMASGKPTRLITFGVLVVLSIAAFLTYFGLRSKPVAIAELRFPVLAIPVDESNVFIANDAASLTQATMGAASTPHNGVVVIDADFNIYNEQNVKCDQGDAGMLFRAFVRPGKPLTFQFNLAREREHGLAAARDRITRCIYLGSDTALATEQRQKLAAQTTMTDIIALLESFAPENYVPRDDKNPTTGVPLSE